MKRLNKAIIEGKLIFLLIFSLLFFPVLFAVDYLLEDFSSGEFPPTGWTIDQHAANWNSNDSNNAGGIAPEAKMSWTPQFNGVTRFISPSLDLSNVQNVVVEFDQNLDHYGGFYTISVETRSNGGEWNTVWQINPEASIAAETVSIPVENDDLNSSDFQVCWSFDGDSYNLNYWYLDNLRVFTPYEHDVGVTDVSLDSQYEPGATITTRATVKNVGLEVETFDITCEIYENDVQLYTNTHEPITLNPDEEDMVTFASFILDNANALYKVVIHTNLAADTNPANDVLTHWLNTYTANRQMVLLELGIGTWSGYCPGAAMGAEDLIANNLDVAVVEYHNGDDYANSYSEERIAYYNISAFPTAVFDGIIRNTDGSHTESMYSTYLPYYNERHDVKTAFTMELYGQNLYNNYTFNIIVKKLAEIQNENMALFAVITESYIQENWQGMNHLDFVERIMLPDSEGTPLDFTESDSLNIQLDNILSPLWNEQNCEIVAFIQDLDTKEILQAAKVTFQNLMPPPASAEEEVVSNQNQIILNNYPNPFGNSTAINYQIPQNQKNATIRIYNLKGQLVKDLEISNSQKGSIIWNGTDNAGKLVDSGIYFYKINNMNRNIQKMIFIQKK